MASPSNDAIPFHSLSRPVSRHLDFLVHESTIAVVSRCTNNGGDDGIGSSIDIATVRQT
jgi:hypothetical protein